MIPQKIAEKIREIFPEGTVSEEGDALVMSVDAARIYEACAALKCDLQYDYLQFLTCIDKTDKLELRYYLYSYAHKGTFVLKSETSRQGGKIKSVSSVWKTADWHERETYDLFGVVFEGHPNLKRILLEEDFEGHPLLKDYSSKNVVKLPAL